MLNGLKVDGGASVRRAELGNVALERSLIESKREAEAVGKGGHGEWRRFQERTSWRKRGECHGIGWKEELTPVCPRTT